MRFLIAIGEGDTLANLVWERSRFGSPLCDHDGIFLVFEIL